MLALRCFCMAGGNIGLALDIWEDEYDPKEVGVVKDARHLMPRVYMNMMERGTVANREHHPDTKKVPDDLALECARLLKSGYYEHYQPRTLGAAPILVHKYYTTIKKACSHSPVMRQVCQSYNVTPAYLLKRMHQVDPNLKWRAVEYKLELTDAHKAARKYTAQTILSYITADPMFLYTTFWTDEFSILLKNGSAHRLHVYADARDDGVHAVLTSPKVRAADEIHLRAIICVNAMFGPYWIEFTTGTTGLVDRLHYSHPLPYMVSDRVLGHAS